MITKQSITQFIHKSVSLTLGAGAAVSIGFAAPQPTIAIPLDQLLFRGIRLFQLSNLSTQEKVALGQDIHQQVLQNSQLNRDRRLNADVNQIGQQLASVSDCPQVPFRFYVVQDSQINAFATTGGFVYVNTGLIRAADNQAQLASVIAHEIAHICNDDVVQRLRQSELVQAAGSITGLDRSTLASIGYQLAVQLPNSREAEFAADADGVRYLRRANYDPRAFTNFLTKLLNAPSQPTFLSEHPAARDRIDAIQRQLQSSD